MKIYLSRSTTRSMMADYPIGDPTGGPAYGEKRDPISAAVSIFAMYTSGTAIATAGMSLMAGLTFAGAAMSLIGNITGNKTLSKIGAITGLVGGIGGFAESAGLFGEGNTLVGALTKGSNVDISSVFIDSPATGSLTPVVDGVQAAGPGTNAYLSAEAANPPPSSLSAPSVNTAPTLQTPAPAPASAGAPLTGGAAPIGIPKVESQFVKPNYAFDGTNQGLRMGTGAPSPVGKPDVMTLLKEGKFGDAAMTAGGKAMDFASSSPYGAYVAAQAIGAGAEYLSGLSDAKLDELKASTGYANARTSQLQADMDREKAKRANINASYANVDAGIKVKQPGLVAGAMQST